MTALPILNLGDTGAAVSTLQTDLNAAGASPALAVDGIYGTLTYNAVIKFKLKHNLTDGTVGSVTWAALGGIPPPPPPPPTGWKNSYTGTMQVSSPQVQDTAFSPNSNGYNTQVENQNVGMNAGNTTTLNVNSPQNWQAIVTSPPVGYTGVQCFLQTGQLLNNPPSNLADAAGSGYQLSKLTTLKVNYNITCPGEPAAIYEFAPDVWTNYGETGKYGQQDIMFWVNTSHTRCVNNGQGAGDIVGHPMIDGQNWTVYSNGGAGGELIFCLNTTNSDPFTSGTAAQSTSGTIDILAGLKWLSDNNVAAMPTWANATMDMMNTGWEITSASNAIFTVNSMSYEIS